MRIPVAVVLVALAALVACDGDGDRPGASATRGGDAPPATAGPTPESSAISPSASPLEPECPNQEAALGDRNMRQPGRLAGDLDDDGVTDEVFLAADPAGERHCQAFIVVESDGRVRSVAIEVEGIPFDMGFPRLISLPLVDDRPGAEIVVGVSAGASTQIAALYTAVGGEIVQVRRSDAANPQDHLLQFGGSVAHQSAFDCAPEAGEGAIVVSTAEPVGRGARFRYERRFFLSRAPGLYGEDESLREEGTVRFDRFESLHEFPNAPFGSCPTGEAAG